MVIRRKIAIFAVAISLACLCVFVSACSHNTQADALEEVSHQEETDSPEEAGSRIETEGSADTDGAEKKSEGILSWAQILPWEKSEEIQNRKMFQKDKVVGLGETEPLYFPTNDNPERIGIECTVNAAKLYNTPEEAGLDGTQVRTDAGDLLYDMDTEMPVPLDTSKVSFLLCDVKIKNINLDLDQLNITALDVVCLTADGNELRHTGLPAYFSEASDELSGQKYYDYELSAGQSMDAKIGWWIDLGQCKKENLYVMYNFGGDLDTQRLWKLDL